jgi:enoyl-CoA hydratase
MVRAGFELAERILSFPAPVVIGCTGHAVAMGMFMLLSGDYRVGAAGPYKITANEVALGITMPWAAVEICRQRLAPTHLTRVVVLAEVFSPSDAVGAGLLDKVVPAAELPDVATGTASELAKLDRDAHATSKLRARDHALKVLRAAIETDDAAIRASAGAAPQPGRP